MTGFKQEEIEIMDKLIQRVLDFYSLDEILEFNDIPEQAVLESLIEAEYLDDGDLLEQLESFDEIDDEIEEDDFA